jgi:hypothetical protein
VGAYDGYHEEMSQTLTPRAFGKGSVALITVAGIILLALIAAYLFFVQPHTSRALQMAWAELTAGAFPDDLAGASYLLTPENGGSVHAQGTFGFMAPYGADIVVTDMTKTADHTASIGVDKKTGDSIVFLDGAPLVSSETEKRRIALSPSGHAVMFAEKRGSEWEVVRVDANGVVRDAGPGFGGVFLSDETTMQIGAEGASAMDWVFGESTGSSTMETMTEDFFIAQSADRSEFVVRDPASAFVVVYRVSGTEPFALSMADFFRAGPGHLALTKDAVYVVANTDSGSTITRHSLDRSQEAEDVLRLPSALRISKLLP